MIGLLPKRPTGQGAEAIFQQWVYDNITSFFRQQQVSGDQSGVTTRGRFTIPKKDTLIPFVRYREEYENDAAPPYSKWDIVQVSPGNPFSTTNADGTSNPEGTTVPGIYICWKSFPDPAVDFPLHPLQDGYPSDFWRWLATWPSEITVCNSVTLANEVWFIDGQKKPEITADSARIKADSTETTADS